MIKITPIFWSIETYNKFTDRKSKTDFFINMDLLIKTF